MDVLIYTPKVSSRIEYTTQFVFKRLLGLEVSLTSQKSEFLSANIARVNYSNEVLEASAFSIPAHPLLVEEEIRERTIEVYTNEAVPYFFAFNDANMDLPFDLLAMTFYLLTRYEEYLPFKADRFGRFTATQSLAFRENFLRIPIIDLWVNQLKERLSQKFPHLPFVCPSYRFLPTYDIDHAWAFLHKGFWRTLGAYGRDLSQLRFQSIALRAQSQLQIQKDPFDTFAFLDDLHRKTGLEPTYFFLLGDRAAYDKNIAPNVPAFRALIQQIDRQYAIGIHPSFQSNESPDRVQLEQSRLAEITGQSIFRSRQHFLRLHLPQTYQHLLQLGIREDYSMGYAADIGFRAGTANDFTWFDLTTNTSTNLQIFPFQVMDVSLRQYLDYDPIKAYEEVLPLIEACRAVNGQFCSLWHNSSFAEVEGWTPEWKNLYVKILAAANA